MNLKEDSFLFAFDVGKSLDARKTHIRRLYDVMQLSLQRNDLPRALRAWAILSRCREVNWRAMWPLVLHVLGGHSNSLQLDFLRDAMLQIHNDRESILKELVHRLILSNRHRDALEELELYLPAFPYQDNPLLHLYASFISLYLSQTSASNQGEEFNHTSESNYIRNAQAYLERSINLVPNDPFLQAYKHKLHNFLQTRTPNSKQDDVPDSDEEIEVRSKRSRT